jgi:hypothetical protein
MGPLPTVPDQNHPNVKYRQGGTDVRDSKILKKQNDTKRSNKKNLLFQKSCLQSYLSTGGINIFRQFLAKQNQYNRFPNPEGVIL